VAKSRLSTQRVVVKLYPRSLSGCERQRAQINSACVGFDDSESCVTFSDNLELVSKRVAHKFQTLN